MSSCTLLANMANHPDTEGPLLAALGHMMTTLDLLQGDHTIVLPVLRYCYNVSRNRVEGATEVAAHGPLLLAAMAAHSSLSSATLLETLSKLLRVLAPHWDDPESAARVVKAYLRSGDPFSEYRVQGTLEALAARQVRAVCFVLHAQ